MSEVCVKIFISKYQSVKKQFSIFSFSLRLMSSDDQIVNRKNKTKRSYFNPEDESSQDDPVQFSKSKAFENPYKKSEDRFHFAKPQSDFTSEDFKKKYSTREAKIERLEKIKIKNERNLSFRFSFIASLIYMLMLREENDLDDMVSDGMYAENPELEKSHLEANMRAKGIYFCPKKGVLLKWDFTNFISFFSRKFGQRR